MKYISEYQALHMHDLDWKHPFSYSGKIYSKTNKLLGDSNIEYIKGDFYAKPSRAFVDLLLNGVYSKKDLIKFIDIEFEIKPDDAYEMLEMLWNVYLHAKWRKRMTFRNKEGTFEEFRKQLGKTFNEKFPQEIVDFKALVWIE